MKMQSKHNTSLTPSLKVKPVWVAVGGVAIAGGLIFLASFLFNTLGIQQKGLAADRYPFNVSASELQKVNFTILPPQVNSVYAEVRPFISANENVLFFCRRNHAENMGKGKDRQDIWSSTRLRNGQWSKPENAGAIINGKSADAICSVNADGSEIVFFHEELTPESLLMRSKRLAGGWSQPTPMVIENYYNMGPYVDFFYSFDRDILLMAVTCNDALGEQDLYVSFPAGKNRWTEPRNLGPMVNTARPDFAPFLAADGRTLFFASYGHDGLGGCDIFQTTRLDDSWTRWSAPKNLGAGINSDREESYFSVSGDYRHIFFESYDLKKEVRDIFRADLPEVYKPAPTPLPEPENVSARAPE